MSEKLTHLQKCCSAGLASGYRFYTRHKVEMQHSVKIVYRTKMSKILNTEMY